MTVPYFSLHSCKMKIEIWTRHCKSGKCLALLYGKYFTDVWMLPYLPITSPLYIYTVCHYKKKRNVQCLVCVFSKTYTMLNIIHFNTALNCHIILIKELYTASEADTEGATNTPYGKHIHMVLCSLNI